jgi:hypothetical protein
MMTEQEQRAHFEKTETDIAAAGTIGEVFKIFNRFFDAYPYEMAMGKLIMKTFEKHHGRKGTAKEAADYWNQPSTRRPRLNLRYLTGRTYKKGNET